MKKLIAVGVITLGMTGTLIGGIAMGAHAQTTIRTFFGTEKAAQENRQYLLGYVAGVSDAMANVGQIITDHSDYGAKWITKQAGCFDADSRLLGQLTDWAIREWQAAGPDYNAASVMIDNACDLEGQ